MKNGFSKVCNYFASKKEFINTAFLVGAATISAASVVGVGIAGLEVVAQNINLHDKSTATTVAVAAVAGLSMVVATALAYMQKNEFKLGGFGAKIGNGILDVLDKAGKEIVPSKKLLEKTPRI